MGSEGVFVYVSNAESQEVLVLRLEMTTGVLTLVQRITLDEPGQVMPIALSPDRRFLYTAQRAAPFVLTTLAINQLTGELTYLSQATVAESSPYIVTDRSGRWLFAASYQASLISVSPVGPQGLPQPPQSILRTEANAHCVGVDLANANVLSACLGGDVVMSWRFDSVTGDLIPNTPAVTRVAKGRGPRHFVFHPSNRFVYLLTELEASIYVFNYDAHSGTLHEHQVVLALPDGFSGPPLGMPGNSTNGGPKAADLHITPDGRFLYASERTSSTLTAFSIDLATGRLSRVDSYQTEANPRGFNIDPSGQFLLAAGQDSNMLAAYAIDDQSGRLIALDRYEMGQGPNWVEIARLF